LSFGLFGVVAIVLTSAIIFAIGMATTMIVRNLKKRTPTVQFEHGHQIVIGNPVTQEAAPVQGVPVMHGGPTTVSAATKAGGKEVFHVS